MYRYFKLPLKRQYINVMPYNITLFTRITLRLLGGGTVYVGFTGISSPAILNMTVIKPQSNVFLRKWHLTNIIMTGEFKCIQDMI